MELIPTFGEKTEARAKIPPLSFVRIFVQLLLIMGAVKMFAIEGRVAFFDYFWPLLPIAFLIHALIPLRLRLPFFVLTTIGLVFYIFKATSGIWLLLIALGLIGMCHLRLSFRVRVGLILVVTGILAGVHAKWIPATDKIGVIIPALGAIFMFRLAVYLYDIQHEKQPVSIWQRLAYFFLLPNPIFTLFPVVDYKTFLKTYYNADAALIYQRGVLWIGRGVVHFILYRLVTNYFSPTASEVTGIGMLAVFVVSSYLIYLRMSGLFHLIAGILCLFGFHMPETHRFYLLATGFNDYWQRINIYWKDLMMKLVYYPVFTRLKGLGLTAGAVIATAAVFFCTFILHAYQSFWMRADARMPMMEDANLFIVDALFWGAFGVLVIINSLIMLKRKPAPMSLGKSAKTWHLGTAVRRAVQIAAMFVLMCLLWSMWQSPSIGAWFDILAQAKNAPANEVLSLLGISLAAIGLGVLGQFLKHRGIDVLPENPSVARATVTVSATMLALIGFGWLHAREPYAGKVGEVADAMRGIDVRPQAQINLERGYYEGLLSADDGYARFLRDRHSAFSMRGKIERPEDFPENEEQWVRTGDIRHKAYQPSATGVTVGQPWQTNQWGMRDQDYSKEKPEGVYRIAVVGASYTMGRGVHEHEDFESQLESLLNEPGVATKKVEILNFATTNYCAAQITFVCEHVLPDFQPDAMFLIAHGVEALRTSRKLVSLMTDPEVDLTYDYFKDLRRKARIDSRESEDENLRRIEPFADEILLWCYQRMADACHANDTVPVWVFLPTTKRIDRAPIDIEEMGPLADRAGFVRLVIEDPYRGREFDEIVLNEWDAHPNVKSHRGIALQLLKTLRKERLRLNLGLEFGTPK